VPDEPAPAGTAVATFADAGPAGLSSRLRWPAARRAGNRLSLLAEVRDMLKTALRTASALGLLAAVAALAPGQNARTGDTPTTAVRAKSLLGATVSLQGGARAGTVEDIVLSSEGVVDYLIVSEGGKLVTVPWQAANFNFEKRMATINLSPEQYKQIPTYTVNEYPQYYSPAYQTQVYKYYNLRPGQVRRLERPR
jgi:hypothetical protein